jgi:acetylornithine deacetylase/succinyl-diaminopimelate desuccinylase-like protein
VSGEDGGGRPAGSGVPGTELSELVGLLVDLLRIPSVNPPGREIAAARYLERVLADQGLVPTVVEPFPGRGSIVCRVRGDGTGGDPLLLLSHLDVVPADPAGWSHDPFSGDVVGGYVWGRGALDMKSMVAMEAQVMRRLARRAREAGLDPARDPIPGLRRDVVFCSSADEEDGGAAGAGWLVDNHPEWLRAAGALNEAGGTVMTWGGARFYPVQVAEKGYIVYRLHVHGRWGHASVPTSDNAAVLAGQVAARLGVQGPASRTPEMEALLERALPHLDPAAARLLARLTDPAAAPADPAAAAELDAALARACDPTLASTIAAIVRDTASVGMITAGVRYNVIPGSAELEIDCRTLPGTTEGQMRAELRRRIGDELWTRLDVELMQIGAAVRSPIDHPLYRVIEEVVKDHDPEGVTLPFLAPFATDAKHLARIGVPVYGFSPLALGPGEGLLDLMHADDERIRIDALEWGLPVLWDAVIGFCS